MKICVVQTKSLKGDVAANLTSHLKWIGFSADQGAEVIVFPELSLTGYEPTLARDLATHIDDSRFVAFQQVADARRVTIGAGMPTIAESGICISMLIFQPDRPRQVYSKKYLHSDEDPFFVSGKSTTETLGDARQVALAICYELSVPEHAERAARMGATIYLASVAKTAAGVEKASLRLAEIARRYSMTVLMANCIGECDGSVGGGKSSIWNRQGELVTQLDDQHENILIFDAP